MGSYNNIYIGEMIMIRLKDVIKLIDNSVIFIHGISKDFNAITFDSNDIPGSYYDFENCRVFNIEHLKYGIKICIHESEEI